MIWGNVSTGRDCTQPQKERACYQCGETGHLARDCPSQGAGNMNGGGGYQARGAGCYKCGKVGHIARDCSQGGSGAVAGAVAGGSWYDQNGGRSGGQACFSCGGYGHTARDCTQGQKCYKCMSSFYLTPFLLFPLA